MLIGIISLGNTDMINSYSPAILLTATALSLVMGRVCGSFSRRSLAMGLGRSATGV